MTSLLNDGVRDGGGVRRVGGLASVVILVFRGAPPLDVGVDAVAVGRPDGQGARDEEGTSAPVALEAAADAAFRVATAGGRVAVVGHLTEGPATLGIHLPAEPHHQHQQQEPQRQPAATQHLKVVALRRGPRCSLGGTVVYVCVCECVDVSILV